MVPYDKNEFRKTRKSQYGDFKQILQLSLFGIAATLVFLALMLKYSWF